MDVVQYDDGISVLRHLEMLQVLLQIILEILQVHFWIEAKIELIKYNYVMFL